MTLFLLTWSNASVVWPAEPCVQDLAKLFDNGFRPIEVPSELATKIEGTVGKLSPSKMRALNDVIRDSPKKELYTAAEVSAQNRALLRGSFSEDEIAKLRRNGVISNSMLTLSGGTPVGIEVRNLVMKQLDDKGLKEIARTGSQNYVLGENGHLYLTKQPLDFPNDKLVVVVSSETSPTVVKDSVVVREAGAIQFEKSTKGLTFKPQYGFETSAPQVRSMIDDVTALNPGLRISYQASTNIPHSRVINCLDILSAQSNGKNFVLDRLVAENMVLVGSLAISEAAGAHRLESHEGRLIVMADILGTNVNSTIGATIGKRLILRDANFVTEMAARAGMGFPMIEIQKQIHSAVVGDEKNVASDIAAFNRGHFIARLPVNYLFDRFMVKQLPLMIFNRCQNNSALSVIVNPRTVRLAERVGSTTLYFGLREAIIEK